MHIQTIELNNFMVPGSATLHLPELGVTVLTGPNGAGKSRWAEAVAYAFWGKTLRGTSPWIEGLAGGVSVTTTTCTVMRTVTAKGTKAVTLDRVAADTPTKTQDQITVAAGEMQLWQRTHVFSSTDASNFSTATDAERKRLIEMLLGLEVFDSAQQLCGEALRAAENEEGKIGGRIMLEDVHHQGFVGSLEMLGEAPVFEDEPEPEEPPAPDTLRQVTLTAERTAIGVAAPISAIDPPPDSLHEAVDAARVRHTWASTRVALIEAGECTECGAQYDAADVTEAKALVVTAQTAVAETMELHSRAWTVYRDRDAVRRQKVETVRDRLGAIAGELQAITHTQAVWNSWSISHGQWTVRQTTRRAKWQAATEAYRTRRVGLEDERDEAVDTLAELEAALADAQAAVRDLQATATVLGVRGLRTHVLGRALDGVEYVANYWLARIAPGASISLRSRGTTKGGKVSDRITLEVKGFGGGDYKASSGGERRRIDAPLLLALAEVAGSSAKGAGTLFLDEVFDALDTEGRGLVAEALGELGQRQPVVVITHAEDLATHIPAVARYRVEAGQLEAL